MASPSPTTTGGREAQASTSTSPAGSPAGSQAARVKRNTACVHCRDSKVKCIASRAPNQPCTRCTKLQLSCVVDRTHKRVSRRSKLEELQQEVRSIKEAVGKAADPAGGYSRPLPLLHTRDGGGGDPTLGSSPWPTPTTLPPPQQALPPPLPTLPPMRLSLDPPLTSTPSGAAALPTTKTLLSTESRTTVQPRAIKSRAFSGEDIAYYFERYFEFFHPYFPIVRTQSPDACYAASPLLFWTIVMTAARRFARDDTVLPFLTGALPGAIGSLLLQQPLPMGAINALLLLCAWPLTTIRYFRDPSMTFAAMAMASSLQIGLHTGRGDYGEMLNARQFARIGDEEATYTWAGLNILAQRIASYLGFLPTGPFFNRTIEALLDGSAPVAVPVYFLVHLDCARFAHRVCKLTTASLEERRGISHHVVEMLETDFDQLQQSFAPGMTDIDAFTVLTTRQDIQLFYLLPEPDPSPAIFMRNVLKTYTTAQRLVRLAARLHAASGFLLYAPHYVFRTLCVSAVVIVTVLLSPHMADTSTDTSTDASIDTPTVADKDALVQDALAAMRACAVHDGELPVRIAVLIETYWTAHRLRPPVAIPMTDTTPFAHHLSTRFALGYLRRWKRDIEAARQSAAAAAAAGVSSSAAVGSTSTAGGKADVAAAGPLPSTDLPSMQADSADLIDWDAFMDDFDWSFSPYLNPG